MKSLFIRIVFMFLTATIGMQGYASAALLGSTTIGFVAGGGPETLGGSWSAVSLLSIPSGATIENYVVTLNGLTSTDGKAYNIFYVGLDSFNLPNVAVIDFCTGNTECVAPASEGSTATISYPGSPHKTWDFLNWLVQGNLANVTSGSATVGIHTFADPVTVSGQVLVQAYGQAPNPVPIPGALFLFAPGLVGLLAIKKGLGK